MPNSVNLLRSTSLADVPYAYASSVEPGSRLLFLAGACPLDEHGDTVAVGDFGAQAAQCMRNLEAALGEAGVSLDDVASTRVLVASSRREDLVTTWEVVRSAFAPHDPPSTLLGVTVLGYPDQLVEVEAVAAIKA
jgi:enamine deaminase RidA (YjgF/YER057c/UK114 family)